MAEDKSLTTDNQFENRIRPAAFEPLTRPQSKKWSPKRGQIMTLALLLILCAALGYLLTATAVFFDTSPAGTKVDVDRALILKLSDSHLMHSGRYQIRASADGYFPLTQTIDITDVDSQRFTLTLQKKPGHLELTSTPDAAQISIGDTESAITPDTIKNLQAGTHQLTLTAPRHFPKTVDVEIVGLDKTQALHVELIPAWGIVEINSQPPGATVLVAGEQRGTTPLSTELLERGEEIKLELSGYQTWQRLLKIEAGKTLQLNTIELKELDSQLLLSSSPSGAGITVDGKFAGNTPTTVALSPGIEHKVSLFLDGYRTAKRTLSLEKFQQRSLDIKLTAETGTLRIDSKPAHATIIINGVHKGNSGQTFTLPAKAHKITVQAKGYASQTKWATPRPGVAQSLSISLLTEKEARWSSTANQFKNPIGQTMKLFRPEGIFTTGASRREPGRRANEIQHRTSLKRGFYLAEKEVTNAEFQRFNSTHFSRQTGGNTLSNPSQPVVNVSWQQAALFCNWLSDKENLSNVYQVTHGKITGFKASASGYRLPTEAEWAWAARYHQGNMMKFPWGDNFPPLQNSGNYADLAATKTVGRIIKGYRDGYTVSAPVASFPPNHRGLYDLGGNVAEWVNDYYGIEINLAHKTQIDPIGPQQGQFRVIRGASWRHGSITELRLSYRDYGNDGRDDVGFRVARYAN